MLHINEICCDYLVVDTLFFSLRPNNPVNSISLIQLILCEQCLFCFKSIIGVQCTLVILLCYEHCIEHKLHSMLCVPGEKIYQKSIEW